MSREGKGGKAILKNEQAGQAPRRTVLVDEFRSAIIAMHLESSCYLAYTNRANAPTWLDRDLTYRMLGQKNHYAGYRDFVGEGNSEEFLLFYSKGNMGSILGEKSFRKSIKEREAEIRGNGDLSQVLSARPETEEIVKAVSAVLKSTPERILKRHVGRQESNLLLPAFGDQPMKQIAESFGFSHVGSVSPATAAIKKRLELGQLLKEYRKIEKLLNVIK